MNKLSLAWLVLLTVALTACGGGNGGEDSAVAAVNAAPIANAGAAQSVGVATTVTLNGSGSTDANADPLTFSWTLTSRPAGSAAVFAEATSPVPTFIADVAGTYVAALVVNDGTTNSTPSTVTVTATVSNAVPVANAGVAQSVLTGTVVALNGSGSSDANGDPLSYAWALTSKPAGSTAALAGSATAAPTFTADSAGGYVASLVVNDGTVNSIASTVTVTAAVANAAPVANAGVAQSLLTGTVVTLDGSGSSDANGDPLTYVWTLTSKPAGSTAVLAGSTTATPTFTADSAGAYVASLLVNDGKVNSSASTVVVTAAVPTPVGGLLATNTRWTAASSPYLLVSDVLVPAGITLSIDPGVRVIGQGKRVQVAGTFSVEGTSTSYVNLEALVVQPAGSGGALPYLIRIVGASVRGGSVMAQSNTYGPGSFVLTDSRLNSVDYIYLYYPTGTNRIARNVFTNSACIVFRIGGSTVGDAMAGTLSIENNAFFEWTGGCAIVNGDTGASGSSSVRLNSFLSTDRVAVLLNDGATRVSLDAANNYWGTTDTSVVQSMIYDRTDSLLVCCTINYTPILTVPDPATPN